MNNVLIITCKLIFPPIFLIQNKKGVAKISRRPVNDPRCVVEIVFTFDKRTFFAAPEVTRRGAWIFGGSLPTPHFLRRKSEGLGGVGL